MCFLSEYGVRGRSRPGLGTDRYAGACARAGGGCNYWGELKQWDRGQKKALAVACRIDGEQGAATVVKEVMLRANQICLESAAKMWWCVCMCACVEVGNDELPQPGNQ